MLPARRRLQELASETGFEAAVLEKVIRLAELLSDIERHPRLRGALVLKGGTALNLFPGTPRRLSVDLYFNYIGALERERMLADRPQIEAALEATAGGQGYPTSRSRDAHAGRATHMPVASGFLGYRRYDRLADRIEVDVNFLHRQCLQPTRRQPIWRPDGEAGVSFPLLAFGELAAGKLCAFLDRVAPRDLWDVARLSTFTSTWPDHVDRATFIALAGALPRPLQTYDRSRLDRIGDAMPDAALVARHDGTIALANALADELFGYVRGQLRGRMVETLLPETLRSNHIEQRASYAASPEVRPMSAALDLRGRRCDGTELAVEVSLSPVRFDGASAVLACIRNVSARKRTEQELRRALDDVARLNERLETEIAYFRDEIQSDHEFEERAVRSMANVELTFPAAPATAWRCYRDPDKFTVGTTPLVPDAATTDYLDAGAILRPGPGCHPVRSRRGLEGPSGSEGTTKPLDPPQQPAQNPVRSSERWGRHFDLS